MRVNKAWHRHAPVEINHLGLSADQHLDRFITADRDDAAVTDRSGLSPATVCINRVNAAV